MMYGNIISTMNGKFYNMQAELDLLEFAEDLANLSKAQVQLDVIQMGDTYDLWMGAPDVLGHDEPLFTKNDDHAVQIIGEVDVNHGGQNVVALRNWIRSIQGYQSTSAENDCQGYKSDLPWVQSVLERRGDMLGHENQKSIYQRTIGKNKKYEGLNPGEIALRLLEDYCGGVSYIYGNHDSYLITGHFTDACKSRTRYKSNNGLWIEHANRLEAVLQDIVAANLDGVWDGYQSVSHYWKSLSSSWLSPKDWDWRGRRNRELEKTVDEKVTPNSQSRYIHEACRFLVGRKAWHQKQKKDIPHIFVIGHTHAPGMWWSAIDVLE